MKKYLAIAALQALACLSAPEAAYSAEQKIQWSRPVTQAQLDYTTQLDKSLEKRDYVALGNKMLHPSDSTLLLPILDWAKARTSEGASVIVPLMDAHLMWAVGTQKAPVPALQEASSMFALYALLVAYADSVKCEDQTAPGRHIQSMLSKYADQFEFLSQLPEERKKLVIDTALALEQKTVSLRGNDDFLCRFGTQEAQYNTQKGKAAAAGKEGTMAALQGMLGYQPKFLPREDWQLKQANVRSQFPSVVGTIIQTAKQRTQSKKK